MDGLLLYAIFIPKYRRTFFRHKTNLFECVKQALRPWLIVLDNMLQLARFQAPILFPTGRDAW